MGAYESLENEKTKVFPSFFVVALLSLSGDIVSVGFKCLSSKAKIDILRKYDKLTLGGAFRMLHVLFFGMENVMFIKSLC